MRHLTTLFFSTLLLTSAMQAQAQFAKPEDAIKYRQSSLFVMSQHFGRLGAMVNGRIPFDAKVAAENAQIVADMSKLPWVAFSAGTDKGVTKAKAEIWTDGVKFKELAEKNIAETSKLAAAAKTGNLDALKAAFGAVGGSCKTCHDAFRAN